MASDHSEEELDYEPEEAAGGVSESMTAMSVDHLMQVLLKAGLADTIKSLVSTEAAKVFRQPMASANEASSHMAGTRASSQMAGTKACTHMASTKAGEMASSPKASSPKAIVEQVDTSVSEACGDTATSKDSVCGAGGCGPSRVRAGAEILEAFDPDSKDCNVVRWLGKIDQLGVIHGWSEYERAYFMQARLQGGARAWYNRLDNYDKTWAEWRDSLMRAFPREHDYAQLLREMLSRTKVHGETMTKYYHDKVGLIERCGITGTKALSCLIDGLPSELMATARAYKCSTVGDLYTGFLASCDKYQTLHGGGVRADSSKSHGETLKRRMAGRDTALDFKISRQANTMATGGIRCYNCQKLGDHISKNCPQAKVDRCMRCGEGGHHRFQCPRPGTSGTQGARTQGAVSQNKKVKDFSHVRLVDSIDSTYKKVATLGDRRIKVYIDTGSERNIIREECVDSMAGCDVRPSSVLLRGFGGSSCMAKGEVDLTIVVDGVTLNIVALISDCDLSGADLLLGQPAFVSGVTLTVRDGKVKLSRTAGVDEAEQLLKSISLGSNDVVGSQTRRAILMHPIVILPGEAIEVRLQVDGLTPGEVCVMPATRRYKVNDVIVTIQFSLVQGDDDHVQANIWNMGRQPVRWEAGRVLARVHLLHDSVYMYTT